MTLIRGDGKVSRLILGGETWVSEENAWIECKVNSEFNGIPVLMNYDSTTRITSFIGAKHLSRKDGDPTWSGKLLTLPVGFHFTAFPKDFPFYRDTVINSQLASLDDSRSISVSFGWPYTNSGYMQVAFGTIYTGTPNNISVWKTDTVVPD